MNTNLQARLPDGLLENVTNEGLFNLGVKIGKLYTDHGLPLDMALDRIKCTKEQKINILYGAQNWLVEHKRNSGATEKAIERQRATNIKTMEVFLRTGETGVY